MHDEFRLNQRMTWGHRHRVVEQQPHDSLSTYVQGATAREHVLLHLDLNVRQRIFRTKEKKSPYRGVLIILFSYINPVITVRFVHSLPIPKSQSNLHLRMWRVKSNYDKHGQLVYTSSPYRPAELSDGDDDDLCVWDYTLDSDEESFSNTKSNNNTQTHPSGVQRGKSSNPKRVQDHPRKLKGGSDSSVPGSTNRSEMQPQPSNKDPGTREVDKALISAVQNLTKLSQYMLKLEVRVGKTTKEAIRQTLDDTAEEAAIDLLGEVSQQELIQRITHLSEETSRRMYLIDRHWRRLSSRKQGGQASQDLHLLDEPDVKSWIKVETKDNHATNQDPSYFTVQNLASGRKFRNWVVYLRELCGFQDTEEDDAKLVNIAWRFLDRDLRGAMPPSVKNVDAFIAELEDRHGRGQFKTALEDPERQERVDKDSWHRIRRLWSARVKSH